MSAERGNYFVEKYKTFNKITLVGALGVATAGAFFAPALIAPALTWAAFDGAQLVGVKAIENYRKSKKSTKKGGKSYERTIQNANPRFA